MDNGLGVTPEKGIFDEDIGEYIIIVPQNSRTILGKLIEIKGHYMILEEYVRGGYDEMGKFSYQISDKNERHRKVNFGIIINVLPSTRRNLEFHC